MCCTYSGNIWTLRFSAGLSQPCPGCDCVAGGRHWRYRRSRRRRRTRRSRSPGRGALWSRVSFPEKPWCRSGATAAFEMPFSVWAVACELPVPVWAVACELPVPVWTAAYELPAPCELLSVSCLSTCAPGPLCDCDQVAGMYTYAHAGSFRLATIRDRSLSYLGLMTNESSASGVETVATPFQGFFFHPEK